MHTEFHSLWPTNIMIRQIPDLAPYNEELARVARDFFYQNVNESAAFAYRGNTASIMTEVRSSGLTQLFRVVQESVKSYLERFYPTVDPEELHFQYNSFVNVQNTSKKWSIPHAHVGNQLVATYYPRVQLGEKENPSTYPGALCFHDPRAVHANWMIRRDNKILNINPRNGTLVVFPGFANHSTFPFFDDESEKLAIVTNVKFVPKSDLNRDQSFGAKEILAFQGSTPGEF